MFEVKNLAFVYIPHAGWSIRHNKKSFESIVKERGRFDVGFVTLHNLKNLRKDDTRIMFSRPAFTSGYTKDFLVKYPGYPRLCLGIYYALIEIYFMDDIVDYCHHHKEFKDLRTALDIRNELNGLPKGIPLRY